MTRRVRPIRPRPLHDESHQFHTRSDHAARLGWTPAPAEIGSVRSDFRTALAGLRVVCLRRGVQFR